MLAKVLVVLCVALVAAPAAGAATWSRPQLLRSGVSDGVTSLDADVSPSGVAAVVWATGGKRSSVRFTVRRPGGRFSAPRTVPGSEGAASPAVAVDDKGRFVVAWLLGSSGELYAAQRRADGRVSKVFQVSNDGRRVEDFAVDVAATGLYGIAWQQDARWRAAFGAPGARPRDRWSVDGAGGSPGLQFFGRQSAQLTWQRDRGGRRELVSAVRDDRGRVGPAIVVSSEPAYALSLQAAPTDGSGSQLGVWMGEDEPDPASGLGPITLLAGVRPPGRAFAEPTVVTSWSTYEYVQPRVALAPSGDAAVFLTLANRWRMAVRQPGRPFGPAADVHLPGAAFDDGIAAVSATGAVVALATDRSGSRITGLAGDTSQGLTRGRALDRAGGVPLAIEADDLGSAIGVWQSHAEPDELSFATYGEAGGAL